MDKDINKPSQVEEIAKLAKDAQGFTVLSVSLSRSGLPTSIPFGFDHRSNGLGFKSLYEEVEKYRLYPERRRGTARVETLDSLIDLVNRQKTEHSVVFYRTAWPNPTITVTMTVPP